MFTAVSLGLFDHLHATGSDLATLAARVNANPDALERLLDGCVGLGLLKKEGTVYSNTEVADVYLRRESDHTLAGYVLYSDRALFPLWSHLGEAVQEGTHRWTQAFGPVEDLFSHFFRTDESMREFVRGMHGFGLLASPVIVRTFDLSRFRRFVDLGGATGHLPIEMKKRYPEMECAVFDLPRVIRLAQEVVERSGQDVQLITGDFFRDELPSADLYAVSRILHDWSEEKVLRLLTKIHDALPPGGGVLICERLLSEDKSGPVSALMQSLNMLVVTEGKERSLSEYSALLRQAGFGSIEGKSTGAPVDAILAIRE